MKCSVILLVVSFGFASSEYYESFTGREINRTKFEGYTRLGLVPFCAVEVAACDAHAPRRMDGSCNNLNYPTKGATLTPFRRLLPPNFSTGGGLPTAKSGQPLPLVRPLRVALMSDGRQPSTRYTHMVVNYNVFLTGDITSVHDTVNYVALTRVCCQPGGRTDPRCIPVEVRNDDLHLRISGVRCMNLTRAITYQQLGCVGDDIPPERVNSASPMLDMSIVYGHEIRGATRGREMRGGLLRSEMVGNTEWPPSGSRVCVNNVPPLETRCHEAPMLGVNAVLGSNLVFIWFFRAHNAIARTLHDINPCWDDNRLYYTAREINIALYLQILYYELMTELLGTEFLLQNHVVFNTQGHIDDYDPSLPPSTSIEYVVSTRWFHTLQEGRVKMYTNDGVLYDEISIVDMNLRTGRLAINNSIAGMTQGCFRQPGGAVDALVDPEMGERVLGRLQVASDVLASDMLKGRDVGLRPYNDYRKLCKLPEAKKFKDLLEWMDKAQVEALAMFYEDPDDIDLYAGILAERPMPGAAIGATLGCIMAEQLRYWRRADRFWYENTVHPGAFTEEQLFEIRKMTLAKLLCLHGDNVDAIQPNAFILPGLGNEVTKCSEYNYPNLNVFRDEKCYSKTANDDKSKINRLVYNQFESQQLHNRGNPNLFPVIPEQSQGYPYPTEVRHGNPYPKLPNRGNSDFNSKSSPYVDPSMLQKETPIEASISHSNRPSSKTGESYSNIYSKSSKTVDPVSLISDQGIFYSSQNYEKSNYNPFQSFYSDILSK